MKTSRMKFLPRSQDSVERCGLSGTLASGFRVLVAADSSSILLVFRLALTGVRARPCSFMLDSLASDQ